MKGRFKGTNTMYLLKKEEVTQNWFREVTYGRVVCDVREGKADKKLKFNSKREQNNTLATEEHPLPIYSQ